MSTAVYARKPRKRGVKHAAHPERPNRKRETIQIHLGAPFWAIGTQLEYLCSFLDEWLTTKEKSKERSQVVQKVAILFVYKYDWNWAEGDKPDADDPDPDELEEADAAIAGEGDLKVKHVKELKLLTVVSSQVLLL